MNQLDQDFLLKVAKDIWRSNFLDKPFPKKVIFGKGYDHQVVLLGNDDSWDLSFRFGITRDINNEQKMLDYLNSNNPPVNLAKTLKQVETDYTPPFNKCLIQIPVNGEPLNKFLEDSNISLSTQRLIGEKLGIFIKWVNSLDKVMFQREDVIYKTFYQDKEDNKDKLSRYGLTDNQVFNLLGELEKILNDKSSFVPCHGDLYPHHIFVDNKLNIGIIDWSDSAILDPIKDFRFFYEPFKGRIVYKELYSELFNAAANMYKKEFPTQEEERRLKLYALGGVLCNEDSNDLSPIDNWVKTYGNDFL